MQITTDPVELWAAPNSRSRQEKTYFDSNFGPFFRTSQIFVRPINGTYVRHRTDNVMDFYCDLFIAVHT